MSATARLRANTVPLSTLDPEAPLDDLEPLRAIVGEARVVALGENSHFIAEFTHMRQRVLRFLTERCGFGVLAFEFGFSEGFALDAWARGEGAEADLGDRLAGSVPIGLDGPLRWMRRHNRTAAAPVAFAGIDIPAAGGSVLPALDPVIAYLREVDAESLPEAETAARIAASFAGDSGAVAAPAWAGLAAAEQDALTASLARLLIRFRTLEPLYVARGGREAYDVAVRRLEGACHADYTFKAMAGLFAGTGRTADTSARDAYMAGSVRWHLDRLGPGARIVLAAHNAHIQTEPISFGGRLTALPMGHYLRADLGGDYVPIALTSVTGSTAEMRLDPAARFGFTVEDTPLDPPAPGSVEAELPEGPVLTDLRKTRAEGTGGGPERIRLHGGYVETPVLSAFDGLISTGASTVDYPPT
ncbi:erythromycin esterase [Actinorhabdospora filicis]|uniref:Erythromycin esterase n=1 Tax=Actinorhabdospora filicis TaxID=1785913 RepID=A0A9W6SPL1_9ACTN|nr:erythromycin esterase family protein [Actinorhabdospora filicis]GLZ79680.1 erythromycin esterase [Actinorhabdospora filicis]